MLYQISSYCPKQRIDIFYVYAFNFQEVIEVLMRYPEYRDLICLLFNADHISEVDLNQLTDFNNQNGVVLQIEQNETIPCADSRHNVISNKIIA